MKQTNFLKKTLLLAALMAGVSTAWAEAVDIVKWAANKTWEQASYDEGNKIYYYQTSASEMASNVLAEHTFSEATPYYRPTAKADGINATDCYLSLHGNSSKKWYTQKQYNDGAFRFYLNQTEFTDYMSTANHYNYCEFKFPATGYKNVAFTCKVSGSNSNSMPIYVVVSIDGGTTWLDAGQFTSGTAYNNWGDGSFNLGVDNESDVRVRLVIGYNASANSDIYMKDIFVTGEAYNSETIYTLTSTVNNASYGRIMAVPTGNKYVSGTNVTVTAKPNAGYAFTKWVDPANESTTISTENPYTINDISANTNLKAIFSSANYYTLTTNTNLPWAGTITRSPSADSYVEGSTVTLTASANEGFTFVNWSTGANTTSINVTMNEAKNITANYIKNTYAHGATNAILAKWTFDGSYSVSDGTGTEKIYMPTGGNFTPVGEISTTYGTTIPTIRPDYCVGSYSDYAMTLKCDDDKNWSLGQFFNTSSNYCLFFNNDNATEWTVSDYTDPAKYNNKNYFEASFPTTDFESMKINFSPCANNESTHMTYGVVYSLDGSTWTSLGTVRTDENNDGTGGNGWNNFYDREISLPAAANHQDKVYVRIIRYSTSEQNQDNKIKYFTVKGTVKYKVALNENTNYTPVAKTADVTLTRTINADKWSTIVLPFALTAEQVTSTFGTNVKVAQFTAKDENTVTMSSVTVMNANEPYMIKVTGSEYTSPVAINGVTIVTGDKFVRHDNFTFQGVYASGTIPNGAYFVKNNQLYVSNGSSTIKPFRAYFTSDAGYAHDLTLVFDDNGDVTSICTLKADGTIETIAEGKVYDLQGRHIAQPTKGLYIVNGKKVVIK
ncbi:MAG: hypothetical protein J6N98_02125 [Prevotella sp.]|nr:hypothetical protein [Prevotella sp.]